MSEYGNKKQGRQKPHKHKQNINASFLKQGSKMNGFYLKRGQGLKATAAHPQPNFLQLPPSPAPHHPRYAIRGFDLIRFGCVGMKTFCHAVALGSPIRSPTA